MLEVKDLSNELNVLGEIITDLENVVSEDVIVNTAILLNYNIAKIQQKYSLELKLTDVESMSPLTKYNNDVEGIKDFINKTVDKYNELALKLNLAIKKAFLKLLGYVNIRASVLEELLDNLKTSPYKSDISLKLSRKVYGIVGNRYKPYKIGTTVDIPKLVDVLTKSMRNDTAIDVMLENYTITNPDIVTKHVRDRLRSLATPDNINRFSIIPRIDSAIYVIHRMANGKHGKFKNPVRHNKRIRHGSAKDMEVMLNNAKDANAGFNSIIDDIFTIIDDVNAVIFDYKEHKDKSGELTTIARRRALEHFKFIKQLIPWIALNSGLHVYNHIGYTMGIAKEFNKRD